MILKWICDAFRSRWETLPTFQNAIEILFNALSMRWKCIATRKRFNAIFFNPAFSKQGHICYALVVLQTGVLCNVIDFLDKFNLKGMPRWRAERFKFTIHSLMCSLRSSSTPESLEMILLGKALILFLGVGKPLYFFLFFCFPSCTNKGFRLSTVPLSWIAISLCLLSSLLFAYFPG